MNQHFPHNYSEKQIRKTCAGCIKQHEYNHISSTVTLRVVRVLHNHITKVSKILWKIFVHVTVETTTTEMRNSL